MRPSKSSRYGAAPAPASSTLDPAGTDTAARATKPAIFGRFSGGSRRNACSRGEAPERAGGIGGDPRATVRGMDETLTAVAAAYAGVDDLSSFTDPAVLEAYRADLLQRSAHQAAMIAPL